MEEFDELMFVAIDDTMRQVFGEPASEVIFSFMEKHGSLKREEVGEKIEVFYAFLEKLLGSEGAQVIRNISFKRFCLKLRREYEDVEKYFSFLDQLYETKFKLLASLVREARSVCN